MLPLHLHTLWIGLVLLGALLACLLVTLVLAAGYGWLRLTADTRAPGGLRALVAPAVLGIVLSGSFWAVALLAVLLGYVDGRSLDSVVVGQAVIFSSAGVAGGLVLRAARRTRDRDRSRERGATSVR
ncbi:hypothetical protein [Halalkalicoccus sp. NIPERK01]|uniref:hypothetical protein n=1 Tax=Halalkalicoccus sp. NIPERK01 TaxID=3053469 RepID=UPI00256EBA48|nr:hypothetical protein [Halalkalicoccus sp. NIPERK01]MDL5363317.1 hypothetical protein [Halalkalicoccus sp. NIPERK01]